MTELERNVADLQRLLELKNKQLSDMSDRAVKAPVTKPAPMADTTPMTTPAAPVTPAVGSPVTSPSSSSGAPAASALAAAPAPSAPATTSTTPAASTSGSGVSAPAPVAPGAEAAREAARAAQEAAAKAAGPTPAAAPKPAAKPAQAPVAAQEPESWVDTLLGNPYVPAGAAVLLGLLGLFAWKRRKKDDTEDRFEDTLGGDDAFAANSLFGTTGGHDVDTTNNSLFNSINANGDGGSVDVHSTEVDPIAEAEVYIAYGREVQAEEILKEALKRQPERQAIRLKLLEIYGGRKDAGAYSSLAREMYDQTGGQNEEWPKVVTMGLSIDPDNPLYTGEAEHGPATRSQPSGHTGSTAGSRAIAGAAAAAAGAAGLADAVGSKVAKGRQEASQEAADQSDVLTQVGDRLEEADQASSKLDDDFGALDFNLDTSVDMTQALDESADALEEGLGSSVDLPSLDLDSPQAKTSPESIDDLGLDIPSIDTLSGPATGHDASEIDLSSIGLDLASDGDTAAGAGEPARWQEMATKLDLASAYEEIGDKEGARELLEEVIKGGDNAQQQKAQAMLSKIS
ncbi:MAG: FimV/HubP family polar landmark protein [Burkholderiaceae bacterium]